MSEPTQGSIPVEPKNIGYMLASRTAIVAAVFCVLVLAFMLRDYLHSRNMNPLYSTRIQTLQVQLAASPQDFKLIGQIRQLDLDMRREYFRNHAFTELGSFLFLGGLVLFLLAWGVARAYRPDIPIPDADSCVLEKSSRPLARWSVAGVGLVLLGLLVTLVIFSRHDVAAEYVRALGSSAYASSPGISANPPAAPAANAPVVPTVANGSTGTKAPPGTTVTGATGSSVIPDKSPHIPDTPPPGNITLTTAIQYPDGWAKNWPQFRGPQGVGGVVNAVPSTWDGAAGKGIRWKTAISLPGENSPIRWGQRLFLSGATVKERAVYCFDADTGTQLWQRAVSVAESAKAEPPHVMDDTGFAAPTMACDGSRVFAIFANGDVVCFDIDGKQVWARNLGTPESTYGYAASLCLFAGHLIIQYDLGADPDAGKSSLLALDTTTGATLWQTKRKVPASWSTPLIINTGASIQIITLANPWVISYDPMSGAEIWRVSCLSGDIAPSPIYANGMVFATITMAKLAAIRPDGRGDVTKTHIAWTADDGLPDIVSPVSNGDVILLSSNSTVTCYETATGKKLWEHDFENAFRASPLFANNQFYLLDITGVTHILDAGRSFKEIRTCPLGEESDCIPAVGDGRLYIRGKTHLYCIEAGH